MALFQKGQSGNPAGRPRKANNLTVEPCKSGSIDPGRAVIERLLGVIEDKEADPAHVLRACRLLVSDEMTGHLRHYVRRHLAEHKAPIEPPAETPLSLAEMLAVLAK